LKVVRWQQQKQRVQRRDGKALIRRQSAHDAGLWLAALARALYRHPMGMDTRGVSAAGPDLVVIPLLGYVPHINHFPHCTGLFIALVEP